MTAHLRLPGLARLYPPAPVRPSQRRSSAVLVAATPSFKEKTGIALALGRREE